MKFYGKIVLKISKIYKRILKAMFQEVPYSYEFENYLLKPSERLLLKGGENINLKGKDFDVLVCLVKKYGRLVSKTSLDSEVWQGVNAATEGRVVNSITKIRKVLEDDAKNSRFIETVTGYGYRFVAKVNTVSAPETGKSQPIDSSLSVPMTPKTESFQVESHKFVPMFLGTSCVDELDNWTVKENEWANYYEFTTSVGRFCLLPFGVGTWHLIETVDFSTLTDLAIWRRRTYHNIIEGEHLINVHAVELSSSKSNQTLELWKDVFGNPGYVLSLYELKMPLWKTPEEIETALKLLACPTPLHCEELSEIEREETISLERSFFQNGFSSNDIEQYGLTGYELGYASWAGVSYYQTTGRRSRLVSQLVEFEIAVQATWWFCHCLKEKCLSNSADTKAALAHYMQSLIIQYGKIKSIGPKEQTAQRTMREAILKTSRLEQLVEDTLELYNRLEG